MIYFVCLGLLISLLLKRDLRDILKIRFRVPFLLIGCLLVQAMIELLMVRLEPYYPFILGFSFLGIVVGLFFNRNIYGVTWILAGAIMNFLVISFHGGQMPVSAKALKLTGLHHLIEGADSRHQMMGSSHFWWLGDWIPFFTPIGTNFVMSFGDIVVGIGIVLLIVGNSGRKGE